MKSSRIILIFALVLPFFSAFAEVPAPEKLIAEGENLIAQQEKSIEKAGGWKKMISRIWKSDDSEKPGENGNGGKPEPTMGAAERAIIDNQAKLVDVAYKDTGRVFEDLAIKNMNGETPPNMYLDVGLENLSVDIMIKRLDGAVVMGPRGSQRTQVVYALQREISEGLVPSVDRRTRIFQLRLSDISKPTDLQTSAGKLKKLLVAKKLNGQAIPDNVTPIFFLEEDDFLTFEKKDKAGDTVKFEDYLAVLRQVFGPDVKVIATISGGNAQTMRARFTFMTESRWAVQTFKSLNADQSLKVARIYADGLQKKTGFHVSDEVLKRTDLWCRRFYLTLSQPGCTGEVLELAMSRKQRNIRKGDTLILAESLHEERDSLLAEQAEIVNGNIREAFALDRQKQLVEEIATLNSKIDKVEKSMNDIAAIAKKMNGMEFEAYKRKLVDEQRTLDEQLAKNPTGDEKAKLLSDFEAKNKEIAEFDHLSELTEADVALEVHRRHPSISFIEIFQDKKNRSWDEFMEYMNAEYTFKEMRPVLEPFLKQIFEAKNKPGRRGHQPIIRALLTGDAGTGKTYFTEMLAKALGIDHVLIKGEDFSESFSVTQWHGAPPGYLGYDTPPAALSRFAQHPSSVGVIDEIDKAHPDFVTKQLLEVMGDGKGLVVDSAGREYSFKDVYFFLTANWGEDDPRLYIGMDKKEAEDYLVSIGKLTRPVARRFDEIITFKRSQSGGKIEILADTLKKTMKIYGKELKWGLQIHPDVSRYLMSELPKGSVNVSDVEYIVEREMGSLLTQIAGEQRGYINKVGEKVSIDMKKWQKLEVYYDKEKGISFRRVQPDNLPIEELGESYFAPQVAAETTPAAEPEPLTLVPDTEQTQRRYPTD